MPESLDKDIPRLPETPSEFATLAGYSPVEGDNSLSPDRHFVREFQDYSVALYIQQLLEARGKRITLKVLPILHDEQDFVLHSTDGTYDFAKDYADELADSLNSAGEFDVDKLKKGGYIQLAEILERLDTSGELAAVSEWILFKYNYFGRYPGDPGEYSPGVPEVLAEVLQHFDEYRPTPQSEEWEPLAEISTPDEFARALHYEPVPCVDPAPKWHCYVKEVNGYRVQLLIEERQHAPIGIQIFTRFLKDDEDPGSLKRGSDNLGYFWWDKLIREFPDLVDQYGRFNIEQLVNGGYVQVAQLQREFEDQGLLDALYQGRRLLADYEGRPLQFHEKIITRISKSQEPAEDEELEETYNVDSVEDSEN